MTGLSRTLTLYLPSKSYRHFSTVKDIDTTTLKEEVFDNAAYFGRIFARSESPADAAFKGLRKQGLERDFELRDVTCSGIEECIKALLKKSRNLIDTIFIEAIACVGAAQADPDVLLINRRTGKK